MVLITLTSLCLLAELPPVAFASNRDGSMNIWVLDSDEGEARRVSDGGSDYAPAWSPDGETIAFNSHRSGGWKIWLVDADGGHPRRLTSSSAGGFNYEYFPCWSPDGKTIVFEKWNNATMSFDIHAVDVDGSNEREVFASNGHDRLPSFSPDGQRIVFNSNRDGDEDLYSVRIDGSHLVNLTANGATDFGASVSTDGSRIVFHSNRSGEFRTYTMPIGGGEASLVEGIDAADHRQGWTATDSNSKSLPYGSLRGTGPSLLSEEGVLLFQSVRDGENDVWSLDLDSGKRARLTDTPANDWLPAWGPKRDED